MKIEETHDLLERLCSLLRAETRAVGAAQGLQPVQIKALGFITQRNRYSDTPQAVTEFLELTKGTVSQTLKVLEKKGLLYKQKNASDKRLVHLKPTAKGRRLIGRVVPASCLMRGYEALSAREADTTTEALRRLLQAVQQANGFKTFASCHSCRFNQRNKTGYLCGLTQEPLSEQDVRLLCREHQYPPGTGER